MNNMLKSFMDYTSVCVDRVFKFERRSSSSKKGGKRGPSNTRCNLSCFEPSGWLVSQLLACGLPADTLTSCSELATHHPNDFHYHCVRTIRHVTLLLTVACLYGYRYRSEDDRAIHRYFYRCMALTIPGQLTKNIKYHTCSFFCLAHDQDLPERDELVVGKDGSFFGGRLGRFFRFHRESRGGEDSLYFQRDILIGIKKGQKPIPELEIAMSLKKHQTRLSKAPEADNALLVPIFQSINAVVDEIQHTSKSIGFDVREFTVSNSGSLESTRGQGGMNNSLRSTLLVEGKLFKKDTFCGFLKKQFSPCIDCRRRKEICIHCSEYRVPIYENTVNGPELYLEGLRARYFPTRSTLQDPNISSIYQGKDELSFNDDMIDIVPTRPVVSVAAVPEPLKARIITKGESLTYPFTAPFQKELHRRVFGHSTFRLIGRELTTEDRGVILGGLIPQSQDDVYVSGDYEAATDNIDIRATHVAFRAYYKHSKFDLVRPLLKRTLEQHVIRYDASASQFEQANKMLVEAGLEPLEREVLQQNGQLMGSSLSFPLLCIINAACVKLAYEEFYGEVYNLADLPVLINGDDIAFRCHKDMLPIWEKYIALVGLKKSVGKNYVSKEFYHINSTEVRIKDVEEIFYPINYSVLFNEKKGETCRSDDILVAKPSTRSIDGLGKSIYEEYVKRTGLDWSFIPAQIRHFYHRELNGRALFLAESQGGIGLSPFVWTPEEEPTIESIRYLKTKKWTDRVVRERLERGGAPRCDTERLGTESFVHKSFAWAEAQKERLLERDSMCREARLSQQRIVQAVKEDLPYLKVFKSEKVMTIPNYVLIEDEPENIEPADATRVCALGVMKEVLGLPTWMTSLDIEP